MVAEYLTTVTDRKLRKTLTMYRLSGHSLAIETGRHRQNRLPREARLPSLCQKTASCYTGTNINHINHIYPEFIHLPDLHKLSHLCGEKSQPAVKAAKYIKSSHNLRETSSVVNVSV